MTSHVLIVFACACGEVAAVHPALDAGSGVDDAAVDGMSDGTQVLPPWSTPTLIPGLSQPNFGDAMPTLRGDVCEMYFASDRDGNQDIYVTTRFSVNDAWGTPTRVAELSSAATDSGPELSADGRTIWIARNTSANGFEIVVATRNSPADAWSMPVVVPELSSTYDERAPQVMADGSTMFFIRNTGTGGTRQVWTATWSNGSRTWTNLHEVPKLNSDVEEENPTTTGDGLEIYFDTTRGDGVNYLVYRSTKQSGDPWATPVVVPELTGALGTELSTDGRYAVMSMTGTDGRSDLYESHR